MPKVSTYTVVPKIPARLERLRDIANNVWWCWDHEAIELFFRMDRELWDRTVQNPVWTLGEVTQARLEELEHDEGYLAQLDRVAARLDEYLASSPWRERYPDAPEEFSVAYLSAEFGLHESISIYSGGLGLLSGDHLKSASDLGIPLVGVGMLYREGYHRQYLNADGWQQERYPHNDVYKMPVTLVRDKEGSPLLVEVEFPERLVKARVWQCNVGRVPLYLLDTDFDGNDPDDREITARLYGGDRDMRIRQEILLGIGAVKMLHAINVYPTVYHMNEGHSAFMTLQRIKELMLQDGLTYEQAVDAVKAASVFTTHTPVSAGNDMFSPEMIEHYFHRYCDEIGIEMNQLLALGRQDPNDAREPFCMTVLALKVSAAANGVSKLHGETARSMWSRTWHEIPDDEVPITSITNGVHTRFWVSRDMAGLYDRYLGPGWVSNPADNAIWSRIDDVPDAELWRTHERRRERLVTFARRRLAAQLSKRGASNAEIAAASEVLDPEALIIGFARRFATYKRANLFLTDPERLLRLLKNDGRPIQMIIAGKAHPQDNQGKELIRNIIHFVRRFDCRNQIVFLEDYDINVARYMVQGVDCWLNTPRRPMEASGTSGMKAAVNGVLNISISDGWWCEAEELGENGWTIGHGESYANPDEQDMVESQMLYELLEREVVPIFYDRSRDGLPREWIQRMKSAIRTISPVFSTHRMVQEYAERFYLPCTVRRNGLKDNKRARSIALTKWKMKVHSSWSKVHFLEVESGPTEGLLYSTSLPVKASLQLDKLKDTDVTVEIYYGDVDPYGRITNGRASEMKCTGKLDGGIFQFEGEIYCDKTGQQGFTVRAVPTHPDLHDKHETALIVWA
ncbi:MAG: alpha-glucan family phosphorylase [Candidatus Hydrogenedentes bacterium]|nr:alpha-glucan family phosphorylase [Candidatus Hydrogenedentota bacterium]